MNVELHANPAVLAGGPPVAGQGVGLSPAGPGGSAGAGEEVLEADRQGLLAEEVAALHAQPYIDPLTLYLEQYADDPARNEYLEEVTLLRDRRCEVIGERYAGQAKTAATLARFRAGYGYSCPDQLAAFAGLVAELNGAGREEAASPLPVAATVPPVPDPERSECYLLTKIRNFSEAQEFCRGPAQQGDAQAQLNMALVSQALKEYDQAFYWAGLVVDQSPEGRLVLGQLYANGQGVDRDTAKALFWYQLAAEDGLAGAQTAFGQMYLRGEGLPVDPEQARRWLLKAARQNDGRAQFVLGEMSEAGLAVEQDPVQALVWYDLASRNGVREARIKVEMLGQDVNAEQFSQAEQIVGMALAGER